MDADILMVKDVDEEELRALLTTGFTKTVLERVLLQLLPLAGLAKDLVDRWSE